MILISKNSKRIYAFLTLVFLLCTALFPFFVNAQQSISLSVTPTLFEMSANPGQLWQSSVKVINTNPFDMTVYASVVNFAPQGETGQGKLLPVFEKMTEGSTLAEWIKIDSEPFVIEQEKSASIPFSVEVPDDASPGGHFAAILVSTQPPETEEGALHVRTAQIVTSLFFVRVEGDINEAGTIRSFSSVKSFHQKPEAKFELRFENKGNVHLQPRGDIKIYNMWGTERGVIPINHNTHFGNVLPESVRKFEFSWAGEQSISDIGRYKAEASLAYGLGETKFVTSSTYFWVIPIKSLLLTIGSLIVFFLILTWSIKLYVRRMLQMAGVDTRHVDSKKEERLEHENDEGDVRIRSYKTMSAPVRSGYLDLRSRLSDAQAFMDKLSALVSFIFTYKIFFGATAVAIVGFLAFFIFLSDATDDEKNFDITINNPGSELNLNSEEIKYAEFVAKAGVPALGNSPEQPYDLILINTSGVAGTAASEAAILIGDGYGVSELSSDSGRVDKKTAVIYDVEVQDIALEISKKLSGALLSARTGSSTNERPNITVFVGTDRVSE